jgi:hypothetical protein
MLDNQLDAMNFAICQYRQNPTFGTTGTTGPKGLSAASWCSTWPVCGSGTAASSGSEEMTHADHPFLPCLGILRPTLEVYLDAACEMSLGR